jgi:DNA repair exonuclease SbcCD ATPase subunit
MTENQLYELLQNNFSNVTIVHKDIYRATKLYKNNPFQIHYFDASGDILKSDFDFANYQRDLLIEDYYSDEGPIQWNFYLYFLVPEAENSNTKFNFTKQTVESNRKLARKFVVSFNDLKKILAPIKTYDLEAPKDIESDWYETLPAELRDDVFDTNISMTSVIQNFVYKKALRRSSPKRFKQETPSFPKIKNLHIQQYREFPLRKNYSFGEINLIHGSNAVGKTSLLEAIELAVCGRTIRNSNTSEQFEFSILGFGDKKASTYSKREDSYYRSCDYHWYKRDYIKDNNLHNSFSRFNYFDADAAALFLNRLEKFGGINKALTQTVLGQNTTNLFERIEKINSSFVTEKSLLGRKLTELEAALLEYNSELANKEKNSLQSLSQEELLRTLNSLGVKSEYVKYLGLAELIHEVSKSDISLSAWQSASQIYAVGSLESFNLKLQSLKAASKDIAASEEKLNELKRHKDLYIIKLETVCNRKTNLERFSKYYSSGATAIPRLQIEKSLLENKIRINEEATTKITAINRSVLNNFKSIKISDAESQLNFHYSQLDTKQAQNTALLDAINTHKNEMTVIFKQIQSYGDKLIITSPEISDCPLCGTDLKPANLATKINNRLRAEGRDKQVEDLLSISAEMNIQKAGIQEKLSTLNNLKALTVLLPELSEMSVIEEIFTKFDQLSHKNSNLVVYLKSINEQLENYEKHDFTQAELNKLINNLGFNYKDKTVESILEEIESVEKNHEGIESNISKIDDSMVKIISSIDRIKKNNHPIDNVSHNSEINNLIENLSSLHNEVLLISKYLNLSGEDTLSKISSLLSHVKALLNSYMDNESEKKLLEDLRKNIKSKTDLYEETNRFFKQAEVALSRLKKVINDQSPEKYLDEFLTNYTESISEIFIQLHAPREFSEVVLTDSGLMLRKINHNLVSLSELSTGQRSALVISVFLAMNKSLPTAPQLIIFDDPVTYVDDLNILTFLDYLLKMVLNEDKQIFFATANQKIASLFIKKFEFLKGESEGFKEIYLSRLEEVENSVLSA